MTRLALLFFGFGFFGFGQFGWTSVISTPMNLNHIECQSYRTHLVESYYLSPLKTQSFATVGTRTVPFTWKLHENLADILIQREDLKYKMVLSWAKTHSTEAFGQVVEFHAYEDGQIQNQKNILMNCLGYSN